MNNYYYYYYCYSYDINACQYNYYFQNWKKTIFLVRIENTYKKTNIEESKNRKREGERERD